VIPFLSKILKRDDQGIILMYHRIAKVKYDPWKLCVSAEHFDSHLRILKKMKVSVSGLTGLPRKGRNAAITFDDGYVDNFLNAKPLLERHGLPATFFIVSGAVGSHDEFWWDHLERLLIDTPELPGTIDLSSMGKDLNWSVSQEAKDNSGTARHLLYRTIWKALSFLNRNDRASALRQIEQQLKHVPPVRTDRLPVSKDQLRDLARSSIAEIGGHTVSHPFLARLTSEEQKQEISLCKRDLEDITGKEIRSFSCPHGSHTAETLVLLKESGYKLACTSRDANLSDTDDPYALPRRVVGNWDAAEFEQQLKQWLN
jgi:peptidoglycan/xylan/chitin deacetylase (PgdA/CDA1 family)